MLARLVIALWCAAFDEVHVGLIPKTVQLIYVLNKILSHNHEERWNTIRKMTFCCIIKVLILLYLHQQPACLGARGLEGIEGARQTSDLANDCRAKNLCRNNIEQINGENKDHRAEILLWLFLERATNELPYNQWFSWKTKLYVWFLDILNENPILEIYNLETH
ncbi:hypothetical protein ACJX0J_013307 [Zea mays]